MKPAPAARRDRPAVMRGRERHGEVSTGGGLRSEVELRASARRPIAVTPRRQGARVNYQRIAEPLRRHPKTPPVGDTDFPLSCDPGAGMMRRNGTPFLTNTDQVTRQKRIA